MPVLQKLARGADALGMVSVGKAAGEVAAKHAEMEAQQTKRKAKTPKPNPKPLLPWDIGTPGPAGRYIEVHKGANRAERRKVEQGLDRERRGWLRKQLRIKKAQKGKEAKV